ncbi:pyruvate, phosphate dikinase [Treponema parvum]|uniref:pyruvate, phosphate dikinase n=1 Tax=Treponema parvum TaxID=138851 RepID=UPI001AEBBF5E|nr:pyruvate, phosphate dikinase [Treponema parvum]QTQ15319.1 pyruvate, phosphate dikinase [Treponema parvum]
MAKTAKLVYFFGNGKSEGNASMRSELGGKGANLAEMTNIGIPVPPGFTISTEVCKLFYENDKQYPSQLKSEVAENLCKLEKAFGKKFGDEKDPLLVSVRSGAAASMPGMMDTILNLGLNDKSVEGLAKKTENPRFAWDAYRRFIQMFGDVAMGIDHDKFERIIDEVKSHKGKKLDTELDTSEIQEIVAKYKKLYKKEKKSDFPQDPIEQMWYAINAVFGSWMNARAIKYRELNNIKYLKGTAVTVMAMVFGNMGEDSCTGVCFSRNAATGENKFYGEYLVNAQGEDVVAGIRTPEEIDVLAKKNPHIYKELIEIRDRLEKHYHDMQDMEFTVQQGKLFLLQCRNGKRTGAAAVKMAVDMVTEKLIDKETAVMRVEPGHLDQLLHPGIDAKAAKLSGAITKGLNASPGAGCGQIVFTAEDAEEWVKEGKKVLLVRKETSPDDIAGMNVSQGILTATGGRTSHAAVVCRGMGKPCVSGAEEIKFTSAKEISVNGKTYKEGDWMTIDGTTGEVYGEKIPLIEAVSSKELDTFMAWCDEIRNKSVRTPKVGNKIKGFGVRANGDQPIDAKNAFKFGAEGIGLCRTEHMFFDPEKLVYFQAMISADSTEMREKALKKILPLQKKDFAGIFKAMKGNPVIIRFLDPPLHEFIPHDEEGTKKVQAVLKEEGIEIDLKTLEMKFNGLKEFNPMLGHRGCRLAVTYPEIYKMQTEAVTLAAIECIKKGEKVLPYIMIPIVCDPKELSVIRAECEKVIAEVEKKKGEKANIEIGTMIEVPRAALLADEIAMHADFFSFGTNDLTQMTFAFSRDDAGKFLESYYKRDILPSDPFKTLDENGVGKLLQYAVEKARSVKPNFHCGICGEHGGDPETIDFCYRAGLNYVSCSPFRVPIARLAAAQAVVRNK